jgi:hypothetical protein
MSRQTQGNFDLNLPLKWRRPVNLVVVGIVILILTWFVSEYSNNSWDFRNNL